MNVLDLFSGIGGMSLGLERAGMTTAAFCEIEPYCQKILAKHWPNVPLFTDVTKLGKKDLDARGITIDLLCGGFPCQDISVAGKQVGLDGERSGLFYEIRRIVREYRESGRTIPWLLIENVPNLRLRGAGEVISALESEGYTCWPVVVGAWAVGAPHKRDRVWIVAHANDAGLEGRQRGILQERTSEQFAWQGGSPVADSSCELPHRGRIGAEQEGRPELTDSSWWLTEPNVGRVANGVSKRVDRLRALGNAVVPMIPELIGKWIMQIEGRQ